MKKTKSEIIEAFCKKNGLTDAQFSGAEKVGGSLDLNNLTSIPEGFNPTVGGNLDLSSGRKHICAIVPEIEINKNFFWYNKEKTFAIVDGIFCEILSTKEFNSEVKIHRGRRIGKKEDLFIAMSEKYAAHGDSIKKAVEDLKFKAIAAKLKKEPINPETEISVMYYRTVTGACEMGVRSWMESNGVKKDKMKAKDLLPLLIKSNAYGVDKFKSLITF